VLVVASASYVAWFWLIARSPASRLAAFSFLTPVFGVAAGALLLGEPVTPVLAAAVALIGFGIWLVNRPEPARPAG
jgi:drug/metabolite transporter (DMT)-like permease